MGKYVPLITWKPDGRIVRATCGMCPGVELASDLPSLRLHLLAHRDHVIALVTSTTTLLSVSEDSEDTVVTMVNLSNVDAYHVSS